MPPIPAGNLPPVTFEWTGQQGEGTVQWQPMPAQPGQSLHAQPLTTWHVSHDEAGTLHAEPMVAEMDPQLAALLSEEEAEILAAAELDEEEETLIEIPINGGVGAIQLTSDELQAIADFLEDASVEEIEAVVQQAETLAQEADLGEMPEPLNITFTNLGDQLDDVPHTAADNPEPMDLEPETGDGP
jgi:hypothetical protein